MKLMLTASPIRTPISRSVRTMAPTVREKGTNWYRPWLHIFVTSAGLTNLTPVTSRIAARQERGIKFTHIGRNATLTSNKTPWMTAELRLSTGVDVYRTADDHRGDGKSADQAHCYVPDPLDHQFSARGGGALLRVDLIDRLQVEQRFQRSHS